MNAAQLAIALGLVSLLGTALLGLILWVLTGIRDEARETRKELSVKIDRLFTRVGEHDSFIAALKATKVLGGT